MRKRLSNLINAGYGGLFITSHEEQRVEVEFVAVATENRFTLYSWNVTTGLLRHGADGAAVEAVSDTTDPLKMLVRFKEIPKRSILMATDLHIYLEGGKNVMLIRRIKDAVTLGRGSNRVLAICGCTMLLPAELEKEFTAVEFTLPDRDTLAVVLDALVAEEKINLNGQRDLVLDAAAGLTCVEAQNAFALSFIETQSICPLVVSRMKANALKKSGVLEIVETPTDFGTVGGMAEAKDWLRRRKLAFSKEAKAYGLPAAKGVLCIGVSGTGKSLLAKATASLFGVPLLKVGKLFGSLVGESERNMRAAIASAEAMAPAILWLDEAEKLLAGSKSSNSTDGGTSARVLGIFLSWMQEKTSQVFVFATANDISQLPPELLRKGRWDELFFVDLPGDEERADIWKIQIERKGRVARDYNLPMLTQATVGWTGAEIECAYTEAMFLAFECGEEPHQGTHLEASVARTVPLAVTMKEEIDKLRAWSQGRARPASATKPTAVMGGPSRKLANN